MAQAKSFRGSAFANGTLLVVANIVNLRGAAVTTSDVSSISYTVYSLGTRDFGNRTAVEGHTAVALTVADVLFDTSVTETLNGKSVTYNFMFELDNSEYQPFPNPGEKYLVRIDFTPAGSYISPVQIIVETL